MVKEEVKNLLSTNSNKWDDRIAFSPLEVSQMLNLPLSTIQSLCRNGDLVAFKISNKWRIKRHELYKFIERQIEASIVL